MINIVENDDVRRFLGKFAQGIDVKFREIGKGRFERARISSVQRAPGLKVSLIMDMCWRLRAEQKKIPLVVNPFQDTPHPQLDVASIDGFTWLALQMLAQEPFDGERSVIGFSGGLENQRVSFHTFTRAGKMSSEILEAKGIIRARGNEQVVCYLNAVSLEFFPL